MDLGLMGKTALVTAATKGLGFALAKQLVAEGSQVVICGRTADRLDSAVEKLNVNRPETAAAGLTIDLTIPDAAHRLVDFTLDTFGGLDILVTNAGGPPGGTFDSIELEKWEQAFELTLLSAVRLIKAALPALRKSESASILTITSISVKQPIAGLLLSNVIRPGVVGLTKSLAQELGPEGIRANSILPGWTETERVGEILAYRSATNGTTIEEERAKITRGIPLGRMAHPAEFGRMAAFMVSPAASYLNGAMILHDGGEYNGLM